MKDVFTYWDAPAGQAKAGYIDLCHETIRKHCSGDFDVHILDRRGLREVLDPGDLPAGFDDIYDRALKTALIRAALLVRHGGIWLDSDMVLLRSPADAAEKAEEYGLAACERQAGVPLTCFIASTPGNDILLKHLARARDRAGGNRRRRLRLPNPFRRRGAEWESLGRISPDHEYYAYPAAAFAPVAPGDACKFLDRYTDPEDIVVDATSGVSLRGLPAATGARDLSQDELLNASFLVSRLFRRALDIEDEQKHRAYEQVSYHRQHSGSWSGPGSTLASAREVIEFLPRIIGKYGIESIGDMPCGDWAWMKEVDLSGVDYTGYDIVEFLIDENRRRHPGVRFEVLDILNDRVGEFDLIICRDFLFHISTEDAVRTLEKFRRSGSNYLLSTTFDGLEANTDLAGGARYGYRDINLEEHPYSMGKPLEFVREKHAECHGRMVGLWRLG